MLDQLERQWHTASVCAAISGGEVEPWTAVHDKFDEYLSGDEVPLSEEQEKLRLLGFK
jgi:hypothetical protein